MTKVSSENENDKIAKVADIVRADFANFYSGEFYVVPDQRPDKWDDEGRNLLRTCIHRI